MGGSSSMQSSSFSSSSSSSSSTSMMSSDFGAWGCPAWAWGCHRCEGCRCRASLPCRACPCEEMSSMPMPTPSQTPREDYTVTSPPMSPPPEMNHKVSGAADYTAPAPNQTADATVLLKVKDGDEYKLALNMQQYSPDDITIKLNGNELVVEAAGHG